MVVVSAGFVSVFGFVSGSAFGIGVAFVTFFGVVVARMVDDATSPTLSVRAVTIVLVPVCEVLVAMFSIGAIGPNKTMVRVVTTAVNDARSCKRNDVNMDPVYQSRRVASACRSSMVQTVHL